MQLAFVARVRRFNLIPIRSCRRDALLVLLHHFPISSLPFLLPFFDFPSFSHLFPNTTTTAIIFFFSSRNEFPSRQETRRRRCCWCCIISFDRSFAARALLLLPLLKHHHTPSLCFCLLFLLLLLLLSTLTPCSNFRFSFIPTHRRSSRFLFFCLPSQSRRTLLADCISPIPPCTL